MAKSSETSERESLLVQGQRSAEPSWAAERSDTYGPRALQRTESPNKVLSDVVFAHAKVSHEDFQFLKDKGAVVSVEDAVRLRAQVAKTGVEPEQALLDAVKKNRVVGFGDIHGAIAAHTTFLAAEMTKLKANGVTHLALELPTGNQMFLNSWTSVDQKIIGNMVKGKGSFVDIITAAKQAGIAVVAVDKYSDSGENDPSRDQAMADNIGKILKDRSARVLFYVGASHLEDGNRQSTSAPSSTERIRQQGISIATFFPQLSSVDASLLPVARDLNRPLSVGTASADLVALSLTQTKLPYGKWDNVLFFPPGYGVEKVTAELKQFGKEPKSVLQDSLRNSQVLVMGEMERLDLYHKDSPHRRFMATAMPGLKRAGLTDLAIDIPAQYQKTLGQFEKTGKLEKTALPVNYWSDDFLAVLTAARKEGVRLHAVGGVEATGKESRSLALQVDRLSEGVASLHKQRPQSKILLWCEEKAAANYSDTSLTKNFAKAGISSTTFASLSEDFLAADLGAVTQTLSQPVTLKPALTSRLRELKNTMSQSIDLFDNVILYPENSALARKK